MRSIKTTKSTLVTSRRRGCLGFGLARRHGGALSRSFGRLRDAGFTRSLPRAWGAASRTCTWLRGPRGSAQGSRARGPWARPSPTCARTFWSAARRPEFHVDLLLFWLQLFRHLQAHMLTKNEENIEQLVVLQIKRVNLIRDS